jgi:uncharacterized protein YjdB
MRRLSLIGFGLCALALSACDYRTTPRIAVLGPAADTVSTPGGTTLTVIPNRVQLAIGSSYQLATDAPFGLESRVQWRSLNPGIAAVTPGGVVTGVAAGTATIRARYSFDTTAAATATVVVFGPSVGSITSGTGSP